LPMVTLKFCCTDKSDAGSPGCFEIMAVK